MASSGFRQALFAAALFALAAQPAAPQATAGQQQLLESIQEILSRDGPYSPSLLEPLTALVVLYEEGQDDALAAVTIERARQVVRVNQGLHTLDQVPYLRQLIRIERARGNHLEAWNLEQDLLGLVRRYPDDLRAVPVFREAAERSMEVLEAYRRGERPPELYLGCYYGRGPAAGAEDCGSGQRTGAMQGMVADAQQSFSEAIAVLLRNGLYDSDELRAMEVELLRGIDLVRTMNRGDADRYRMSPMASRQGFAAIAALAGWELPYLGNNPQGNEPAQPRRKPLPIHDTYHRGRQSLARLYAYDAASSRPILGQALGVVQMSDWELLYSNNGNAVEGYALVLAALRKAGVPQASIDELFLPELPVVLPSFQPNPLARDETRAAKGHIDVAFAITKYGSARGIELLDVVNAQRDERHRLVHLLATSRFRPRPASGEFGRAARVVVRYFVYD